MTNFKAEEQFILADELIKENRLDDAVKTLMEIITEDPSFGKAHNHLGWIYETKVKDFAKAKEHYQLAIKLAPYYTATYINYIYLLSALKKSDELEEHLKKCESIEGINRATLANEWGIFYEDKGMYDKAIEKYKDYVRLLYDENSMDTALKNIERCKKKKAVLDL